MDLQKDSLYGISVAPIKKRSHSRAAPRPSLKAHTTRLWPRRQSPHANTPLWFVVYFSKSAFALLRWSRSMPMCLEQRLFRAPGSPSRAKPVAQGKTFFRAATFLGMNWPFSFFVLLAQCGQLSMTMRVISKFRRRGQIHARIGAKLPRSGFLLARSHTLSVLGHSVPRLSPMGSLQRQLQAFPPAPAICSRAGWTVTTPSPVPISPPPITITSLPVASMKLPFLWPSLFLVFAVRNSIAKCTPELAPENWQITRRYASSCEDDRSPEFANGYRRIICAMSVLQTNFTPSCSNK